MPIQRTQVDTFWLALDGSSKVLKSAQQVHELLAPHLRAVYDRASILNLRKTVRATCQIGLCPLPAHRCWSNRLPFDQQCSTLGHAKGTTCPCVKVILQTLLLTAC